MASSASARATTSDDVAASGGDSSARSGLHSCPFFSTKLGDIVQHLKRVTPPAVPVLVAVCTNTAAQAAELTSGRGSLGKVWRDERVIRALNVDSCVVAHVDATLRQGAKFVAFPTSELLF